MLRQCRLKTELHCHYCPLCIMLQFLYRLVSALLVYSIWMSQTHVLRITLSSINHMLFHITGYTNWSTMHFAGERIAGSIDLAEIITFSNYKDVDILTATNLLFLLLTHWRAGWQFANDCPGLHSCCRPCWHVVGISVRLCQPKLWLHPQLQTWAEWFNGVSASLNKIQLLY